MAKTETFQCTVVTPERKVLECDAKFVAFPAHDGEIGIMVDRSPLVCKLGIGPMRIEQADGEKQTLLVDGGFAEVSGNSLTILTEQAKTIDELDADTAQAALVEATAMRITDEASYTARDNAIKRAKVQITLAKRS